MVQGEKTQGFMMSMGNGRTNDPSARKAGYEAVQNQYNGGRDSNKSGSGAAASPPQGGQQQNGGQYGSWGSVFKNKSNFTEMHWC